MIYFDWCRSAIVNDVIIDVYWVYLDGLRFANVTAIICTIYILINCYVVNVYACVDITTSLGHEWTLNLSLNDWFTSVKSYTGVAESGCSCEFVYWLFEDTVSSMSALGKFWFWCSETIWSLSLDLWYSILTLLFQIWNIGMSQYGMLPRFT
jgi:hypothetical protein